ncbi:PA14 domain-containing protein [Tieghemostelium lacteum]|uniref:PA14 domain-containing protein n=1 Tax=Tieghemostelium lacteum TaxID=361077 RepID=A0A151Z850_TIELA|nr:PA14 domain-containing protein [Tieghemostelium lacteum]|eukprot:KYQ90108.1 PA14 domain-containing protein [Tieghemostelium lacteum]
MKVNYNLLFVLLLIVTLSSINAEAPASTITMTLTLLDHHPSINNNFESDYGDGATGMVQSVLDSVNKVPVLSNNDDAIYRGRVYNKTAFPYFFRHVEGQNLLFSYDIVLNYDSKSGTYKYENFNFFPLDDKGWDVSPYKLKKYYDDKTYHNYHFCAKLNSIFTYKGGEVFNFNGDDDVWVFINSKLAVDLGGIHVNQSKDVDLDDLGLSIGTTYNFDFFYCERHTVASNMKIETSIEAKCPKYDYCGICLGSGADCCNPAKCDGASANPCRIYKCPSVDSANSTNYYQKCTYTDKVCNPTNVCFQAACNPSDGTCKQTAVTCEDKTSQCLLNPRCDSSKGGCIYDRKCPTNACFTASCDGSGGCVPKNCTGTDKCKIYSCDTTYGCQSKNKCQPSSACMQAVCSADGTCSETPIQDCKDCDCTGKLNKCQVKSCNSQAQCVPVDVSTEDGNACTTGSCDLTTGQITQTLKQCGSCQTCNSTNANCDNHPESNCNDGNICTVEKCDASGNCIHANLTCDDGDACTDDVCDQFKGCQHTPKTCKDLNACQIGYCDKVQGCLTKERECKSDYFCIETRCDPAIGCLFFDKECVPDRPRCQKGVCNNETQECSSKDYDPMPFICDTAKVVSTSVIAGVTVAGAVAVGLAIFGGKKGYDYWKETRGNKIQMASSNPLYEGNAANGGENPLYNTTE